MKSVRGFTLIELMVTLAIMVIIATMAAPSFNNMLLRQDLNASSRNLIDTLANARAKAALERRNITVNLNSTQVGADDKLNWSPEKRSFYQSSSIQSLKFRFDGVVETNQSNKQPIAQDVSLVVCDNQRKNSRKIIINRFGVIQDAGFLTGCS